MYHHFDLLGEGNVGLATRRSLDEVVDIGRAELNSLMNPSVDSEASDIRTPGDADASPSPATTILDSDSDSDIEVDLVAISATGDVGCKAAKRQKRHHRDMREIIDSTSRQPRIVWALWSGEQSAGRGRDWSDEREGRGGGGE